MKYIPLFVSIGLLASCVPMTYSTSSSDKTLLYEDYDYESGIGTVQLFPNTQSTQAMLNYPVISLSDAGINLSFDIMGEEAPYLIAKLIHCNADWTPSNLNDIQILEAYNDFSIDNYSFSSDTHSPYVHFKIALPTPKVSGNYIVLVSQKNNPENYYLTRRFLVYDQKASVLNASVTHSYLIAKESKYQHLSFDISRPDLKTNNLTQGLNVMVMQNHNWNTRLTHLTPSSIQSENNLLEYRPFDNQNELAAGNELRVLDLTKPDYPYKASAEATASDSIEVYLNPDEPRLTLEYEPPKGMYIPSHATNTETSEYLNVHFELKSAKINGAVYVTSPIVNWELTGQNEMHYDDQTKSYKGSLWLKQGLYHYLYWVKSPENNPFLLEGNFSATQNNYEILVYYRNQEGNYDTLIGYYLISGRH